MSKEVSLTMKKMQWQAQKYDGVYSFTAADGVFKTSIIL